MWMCVRGCMWVCMKDRIAPPCSWLMNSCFYTIYNDLFKGAIYDLLNNDNSILIEFYSGWCLFIIVVVFPQIYKSVKMSKPRFQVSKHSQTDWLALLFLPKQMAQNSAVETNFLVVLAIQNWDTSYLPTSHLSNVIVL